MRVHPAARAGQRGDHLEQRIGGPLGTDRGDPGAAGAAAVRDAATDLPDDTTVADVLRTAAREIARANPSTMSALLAGGLLKAAKEVGEDPVDLAGAVRAGRALFDSIAAKGKSALGDKTILDALGPSLDALEAAATRDASTTDALDDAIAAASAGIEQTTALAGRKGRARWVGERGQGHPDPGAVLYLRFLEVWRDAVAV
ncbi:MAG: DAK2 domain-containing protein [Nitriliruptoraceae bacterium]|nr:DAK2 domain-containing protein [Nitriliruptoraceae bacterium]